MYSIPRISGYLYTSGRFRLIPVKQAPISYAAFQFATASAKADWTFAQPAAEM